jgi:hypothetical protein
VNYARRSGAENNRAQQIFGIAGVMLASGLLTTTTSPAPARALDACVSTVLGTAKVGSASCSSSGVLSVAIAFGANTTATANGWFSNAIAVGVGARAGSESTTGWLNQSIALGDQSQAFASAVEDTSVNVGNIAVAIKSFLVTAHGGSLNFAAAFLGAAEASGGNFNLATAVNRSTAFATNGNFNIAHAGGGAQVESGSGNFNIAASYGAGGSQAINGNMNIAATLNGEALATRGNRNVAIVVGDLSSAFVGGTDQSPGNGNIGLVFGKASGATSGGIGSRNFAAVFGDSSAASASSGQSDTVSDGNRAIVIGKNSTAIAGPGSHIRVRVVGNNKTEQKP